MPLINELASLYPSSKFVSIVSDHCIENYPDKNVPTLLVYRKGALMGQIVGLGSMNGMNATLRGASSLLSLSLSLSHSQADAAFSRLASPADVERVLFAFRGIDFHLKVGYHAAPVSSQFASRSDAAQPLSKGGATQGEGRPTRPESGDEDGSGADSDDDDQAFVGGGRRSGIRQGSKLSDARRRAAKKGGDDSDSDFDL